MAHLFQQLKDYETNWREEESDTRKKAGIFLNHRFKFMDLEFLLLNHLWAPVQQTVWLF